MVCHWEPEKRPFLIEVDNKRILVGVTPGHIQTLHVLDDVSDNLKNENLSPTGSFESKLEEVMEGQKRSFLVFVFQVRI